MSEQGEQRQPPQYGQADASFQAAGGQVGLQELVEAFYGLMASHPRGERLVKMHPPDLAVSVDKLARFFCGWLGGPKRYNEKYGTIRLPFAHAHLSINEQDKEDWLWCMEQALAGQPYEPDFKDYLMVQLRKPAERIVLACQPNVAKANVTKKPGVSDE